MGRHIITCAVCGGADHDVLHTFVSGKRYDYLEAEHVVVACRNCGLVFLNPQHEEADYIRYYARDDYAPITMKPERLVEKHPYRRVQAAFLQDTMARIQPAGNLAGKRILDIGCGPGVLLYLLREMGADVVGLEGSEIAADYARTQFGLDVRYSPMQAGVFEDGTFDIVISTAAIEHFCDPLAMTEVMLSYVRPGGLLYLNTPDYHGMVLKKGLSHWFKFVHTYYFTENSLSNLMTKAGLQILRSWTMPPQMDAATLVYPGNYWSGELNIIGVRPPEPVPWQGPVKDEVADLRATLEASRARDHIYEVSGRWAQFPPIGLLRRILARMIPARDPYAAIMPQRVVDTALFPPLHSLPCLSEE